MPIPLIVHAAGCQWKAGQCSCTPQVFQLGEVEAAQKAHGGDAARLQIGEHTPPETNWDRWGEVPAHKSQASRHRRPISD